MALIPLFQLANLNQKKTILKQNDLTLAKSEINFFRPAATDATFTGLMMPPSCYCWSFFFDKCSLSSVTRSKTGSLCTAQVRVIHAH